jgi:uncharacterized RDD family membrane protein YckC
MTQHEKDRVELESRSMAGAAKPPPPREAMPILELRRFLADELDGSPVDGDFSRSFMPLTDGLGIAPPIPKPAELATKAAQEARVADTRKGVFETDPLPQAASPLAGGAKPAFAAGGAPSAPSAATMDLPIGTATFGAGERSASASSGPDGKAVNADRAAVLAALGGNVDGGPAPMFTPATPPSVDAEPAPKLSPASLVPLDKDLTPTERVAVDRLIESATPAEPRWSGERLFLEEEDPRKSEVARPMLIPELPPPPMPDAGPGRRLAAVVLDQAFVLTLWGITLTIMSAVLGGGIPTSFEMLAEGLRKEPVYWRFAILSFATLWLAHFAIGLGIVDRTFGMWVWGLKVRAFGKTEESTFFRRLSRILLSFFFYAPIVPALLLIPRYKRRNLLDWMTGTALYRTLE